LKVLLCLYIHHFPFGSRVDLKRHSTSYIRHLSHRSMNEPEKHYKTFGIIEHICDKQTKRWVGRVDIVSVSVNNHVVSRTIFSEIIGFMSVLLRYTDSDCPFGIFKLFLFINPFIRRNRNIILYFRMELCQCHQQSSKNPGINSVFSEVCTSIFSVWW
jgi:hypothetical protein